MTEHLSAVDSRFMDYLHSQEITEAHLTNKAYDLTKNFVDPEDRRNQAIERAGKLIAQKIPGSEHGYRTALAANHWHAFRGIILDSLELPYSILDQMPRSTISPQDDLGLHTSYTEKLNFLKREQLNAEESLKNNDSLYIGLYAGLHDEHMAHIHRGDNNFMPLERELELAVGMQWKTCASILDTQEPDEEGHRIFSGQLMNEKTLQSFTITSEKTVYLDEDYVEQYGEEQRLRLYRGNSFHYPAGITPLPKFECRLRRDQADAIAVAMTTNSMFPVPPNTLTALDLTRRLINNVDLSELTQ